ncbi:hypothetical protein HOO65_070358 [Ceratocystis lukuohia]|uniref:Uncharacterized protein n=1 Tax=Ceratocystis lukuohia TaxID=2019550 RepID=A0ABR4MCA1_9PEZI
MCMQAQAQAQAQTQIEHQDETQRQASLDNVEVISSPNGHGEENISRHLASSSDSTTGTNQPAYSSTGLPAGLDFAVVLATQKVQREGFTGPMDSEAHGGERSENENEGEGKDENGEWNGNGWEWGSTK